jgi:DMSO reductase anchor subunit
MSSVTTGGAGGDSYYGQPILKEPIWKPEIPMYFFTGGLAGASAVLSFTAKLRGNERLAKTSLFVGLAGEMASPVLLILDLGRPERFLNMLRVFKPTSPMSVGSWILMASGAGATTEAALELLDILPRLRLLVSGASALLGSALSVYTATLVSDTAVPAWHEGRYELPFIFGASAGASAGAGAALLAPPEVAGPARRLAIGGALVENAAMKVMEHRLGFVGEPYKQGRAGKLTRLAQYATLGGAALLALGRRRRTPAVIGSALMLAGEVALRWSVFEAGKQSARDPKYTVRPQRERVSARGTRASTR